MRLGFKVMAKLEINGEKYKVHFITIDNKIFDHYYRICIAEM